MATEEADVRGNDRSDAEVHDISRNQCRHIDLGKSGVTHDEHRVSHLIVQSVSRPFGSKLVDEAQTDTGNKNHPDNDRIRRLSGTPRLPQ